MRTLVVSDLHLGARSGSDVLRGADALAALLEALAGAQRLALLGDVLELRQGPARDALAAAQPVLEAVGSAIGPEGEVVLVAGNHDHYLLSGWLERRARRGPPPPLGLENPVDWRAGEALATVARALAPAKVRAAYPGVWLRPDAYAMHGHYMDRHTTVPMLERLGAGIMARVVGEPANGSGGADGYEAILGPIYAWIDAVAQHGGRQLGRGSHGPSTQAWRALSDSRRERKLLRRGMIAAFPLVIAALSRTPLGPLRADISGEELRRAALRALSEVVSRLAIDAPHVVFGHTHRAGPLAGDDSSEWLADGGAQLMNTGSWVHDPAFLGPDPARSPYRPGFAVRLEDEGPPELLNLLDRA